MSNSRKKAAAGDDEVEQLLRAAQDDVLLKLSVSSHMARGSSAAAIDPDLDRRFQALRKPNPSSSTVNTSKSKQDTDSKEIVEDDDAGVDLFSRFAALKNSLPSSHSNNPNFTGDGNFSTDEQPTEEEDEVEKVIKWAIDAARLDPSPDSDSETDEREYDSDEEEEEEDDDGEKKMKNKSKKR